MPSLKFRFILRRQERRQGRGPLPGRFAALFFAVWLALVFCLAAPLTGCSAKTSVTAESDETIDNWLLARRYQAEGRYELARQHYALALAAARTQSGLNQLQRELYTVDMQLRTMR